MDIVALSALDGDDLAELCRLGRSLMCPAPPFPCCPEPVHGSQCPRAPSLTHRPTTSSCPCARRRRASGSRGAMLLLMLARVCVQSRRHPADLLAVLRDIHGIEPAGLRFKVPVPDPDSRCSTRYTREHTQVHIRVPSRSRHTRRNPEISGDRKDMADDSARHLRHVAPLAVGVRACLCWGVLYARA